MRRKSSRLQSLAQMLEIPQDIVLDLPRVTIIGNQQVLIENHKGIIEYTPDRVRININHGEMIIIGENFSLGSLQAEQIVLEGKLREIKYDV